MSPSRESNTQPKGGAYGDRVKEQAFIQQTAAPAPDPAAQPAAQSITSTQPSPLGQTVTPEPTIDAPLPPDETATPNIVQLADGTTLNLDEIFASPTRRPDEPVTATADNPEHSNLADLFDAMNTSSPAPDIAGLADLARRLGI